MSRLLLLLCLLLAACTPMGRRGDAPVTSSPPGDFWLSVTVLGPVRENMSAYEALPRALRPGRYVVEADRILRAAMGPGAKDEAFPPATRRLSAGEFAELYRLTVEAGLLDQDNPAAVGTPPPPQRSAGDMRTTYIISTHAGEKRRTLAMQVSPQATPESRRAARVVDWLAGKAWLRPSSTP